MSNDAVNNLIDDSGANRAVNMFLAMYGNENAVSIARMQEHLENCGFAGCSPAWVETETGVLTIDRARQWIRHMFELENASPSSARDGS